MYIISQPQKITEPGTHAGISLSPDYLSQLSPATGHQRSASSDSRKHYFQLSTSESDVKEPKSPNTVAISLFTTDTKNLLQNRVLHDGHNCQKEECQRIIINVSGMKFETQLRTLNRLPNTLLGDKAKREQYWDNKRNEFFFDRHRPSFQAILYFYQSGGRLRRPFEVPHDVFVSELLFFELGQTVIDSYKESQGFMVKTHVENEMPTRYLQRKIWELFEYPQSSIAAKILAIMSVAFIVLSVVSFCVETLPEYKESGCIKVNSSFPNTTKIEEVPNFDHPLFIIEATCICWFVLELAFRLVSSPSKIKFFKNFLNWIDFISITPFIVSIIMYIITNECEDSSNTGVISVLRVLRVARILKLSKHSEGLQLLGKTLTTSFKELLMFLLFLSIGIVIFSSAIFYAELEQEGTLFDSIPGSFWWAVVTMTTVGYGDMYPVGLFGKVVGTFAVLSGLLSIALPVPVIVTNFNNYYRASRGRGSWE